MIDSVNPLMHRRVSLGLSLTDLQSRLSAHGFNYSVDTLRAIERGERRFPLESPGFTLAFSRCLDLPVTHVQHNARQMSQALQARNTFQNRFNQLRPQNKALLRFVLRHPILTMLPGFDTLFEIVKSIALQLPDEWFE